MKNYLRSNFILFLLFLGLTLIGVESLVDQSSNQVILNKMNLNKLSKIEKKKARGDFFFNILRDPSTNSIPQNIRSKELKHARTLPHKNNNLLSKSNSVVFDWFEIGPNDIGGRTRALAVDVTNSNTVIAAGVSGGIWKSTNNGDSWEFKNNSIDLLSITSIIQDPRDGFTNNWYACGGEFDGSSASDRGFRAYFRGNGIYKSIDNGENWAVINSSISNPTRWDSDFDYMSKLIINPITGTIFGVSHGLGIIKSTDGGESFTTSIGGFNDHYYSDLIIKSDGTLVSVLSEYKPSSDTEQEKTPGIYQSTDDGDTWTDITPAGFPESHERSVLATSNLATPIFYVLTNTGDLLTDDEKNEDIRLFKMSTDNSVTEDLTTNLPAFASANFTKQGHLFTQGNYNMAIAVKPNDDNFIFIAGTSLFRSTNGFSSPLDNSKLDWIGGYHKVEFFYPDLHPDIHNITFDPNDANKVWVGHDGGLSYTDDVNQASYLTFFPWINKNNSYNVTQFYTVSLPKAIRDYRIMGGTQDNGTPYFNWKDLSSATDDISSGDGAYCYFSSSLQVYSSYYEGNILRFVNSSGLQYDGAIKPDSAKGQLFINPFVIDPNSGDKIMYYPAGNSLWRNSQINNQSSTNNYWVELTDLAMPTDYTITTLSVSNIPQNILYYGAYNSSNTPKIYRVTDSDNATTGFTDISVPNELIGTGAYIHDIAINPDNADEIITVFSNYNIEGLFHSMDGGNNYSSIEGNLLGDENTAGPSIRRAIIVPYNESTLYLLATSTGLYSTANLNGEFTIWELESSNGLGNVVVEYLDYRISDKTIAVGTHGRGIFLGKPSGVVGVENDIEINSEYSLSQNYPNPFNPSTKISFNISSFERVDLTIYNGLGEKVITLLNKELPGGNYSIDFDGSKYASGIYYYKLAAGNFNSTKKMILMK